MSDSKQWFHAQKAQAHPSLANGIADFLSKRHSTVDTVVDLWCSDESLLQSVAGLTGASKAVGFSILSDDEKISRKASRIRWREPHLDGPTDQLIERPDVIIGIPSPYWSPQHIYRRNDAGVRVHLTEDPSNVAMIDACRQLKSTGVGIFMVGAGVLMRPGPGTLMAKLHEFGLYLEAVIEVPRGLVSPDRGAGQSLVAISKTKRTQPSLGRLNQVAGQIDELTTQRKSKAHWV